MAQSLKLIELTSHPWADRWKVLQEVFKTFGAELEVEIKQVGSDDLREAVVEVVNSGANFCRITDELIPEVVKFLPNTTMQVNLFNSAALLINKNGMWWPEPLVDLAFTRVLSTKIGQVDLNSAALVIGGGGASKLIISALVRMGFSTINIADENSDLGWSAVNELKSKLFGVQFDYIPTSNLTTLPGIHSIVVNSTPLDEHNELYTELYFFNFLKTGGVVVDLTLVPSRTPLIIEAEKWGARFLEGDGIVAERDALMTEKILGQRLDIEKYRKDLRALIDAVPFDPGPYLKRFQDRSL